MPERVAIAGATGYTGQRLIAQLAEHPGWTSRALVRAGAQTRPIFPLGQDFVVCNLSNAADLAAALKGCSAVIQTIGTTQAQFGPGVSYETVDYGTTVALIAAARQAGARRFLLLSSIGAGQPVGAYLKWKRRTEQALRQSDLDWTIVRPAAIVGPGRRAIQLGSSLFTLLSAVPLAGRLAARLRPIEVTDLARCFIRCLDDPGTIGKVLSGRRLWEVAGGR
jgi:uncharacterized protein YbjT (DUF2867 family)